MTRSAAHGLRWYEVDPSPMLVRLVRGIGLARNVVQITPPRQAQEARGLQKPTPPAREPEKVLLARA